MMQMILASRKKQCRSCLKAPVKALYRNTNISLDHEQSYKHDQCLDRANICVQLTVSTIIKAILVGTLTLETILFLLYWHFRFLTSPTNNYSLVPACCLLLHPLERNIFQWFKSLKFRAVCSFDVLGTSLGILVLRIWPTFVSVFRFKIAVLQIWCLVQFVGFVQFSLSFSTFANNNAGFSDFFVQCILQFFGFWQGS